MFAGLNILGAKGAKRSVFLNEDDIQYVHESTKGGSLTTLICLASSGSGAGGTRLATDADAGTVTIETTESIETVAHQFQGLFPARRHDKVWEHKKDGEIIYVNPARVRIVEETSEQKWCIEFRDGVRLFVKDKPAFL